MLIFLNDINLGKTGTLAFISFIVGFAYLLFIRHYDKYEKEPLGKLILFSFFGGIVSILVTFFFYLFIHPKERFLDAIFLVGTTEEIAKLLSFLFIFRLIKKDFDEIVDGIIYMAALALGFSVIENLFYAMEAQYPYKLLALRFVTATIGHISFSIYMGIALYIHKKIHKNYLGILLSILLSILAHGIYDGVIFEPDLNALFIPVFIILVWIGLKLLKMAYAYSKKKHSFALNSTIKKINEPINCCHCEGKVGTKYEFIKNDFLVCETCQHVLIEVKSFKSLVKYYRPILNLKKFTRQHFTDNNRFVDEENQIFYHAQKQLLNAPLPYLNDWFKNENNKDVKKYHHKFLGILFYYLGLRFL